MKKIYVTQPYLPPLEEFTNYLEEIWENKWITNNGPFHKSLEKELADYLGVKYISLFANGTLALLTALQTLRITGEVITTPYSFVATTNSLWWNNLSPVFVDIEPIYCNLDPDKIESAITPKTSAILPVHVYGNPCDVEKIQKIADTYGLKVIYDAAHAFGVKYKNQSILNYGDLSILSFHATKVYNTFEGGAIISHDKKTKERIDYLKNFGFANETTVMAPGINSKMNEIQAAFGLLQLKYIDESINKRKLISDTYIKGLNGIKGIDYITTNNNVENFNYSYFPIFVNENDYKYSRDELYLKLKENNYFGRRYFYPLITSFPTYRGIVSANEANIPMSVKKSESVICLPIYPDLDINDINKIIDIIV